MEKLFINPHMDGSSFFFPGGPVGILLIHGFTATTVEVRPLGEFFRDHGYTVAAPLLPGHFTTLDDLSTKKWQNWTNAAEDQLHQLLNTCSQVFVGGESMGGLISLYLASRTPQIRGLMLFAPALQSPNLWMAEWLAPFMRHTRPSPLDQVTPWQGYAAKPLRAAAQLYRFQGVVRALLPQITQPAVIFQSHHDQTIDPVSAEKVLEGIASQDKSLHWMDQSGHCILLDPDFPAAAELCLQFVRKHTAPTA